MLLNYEYITEQKRVKQIAKIVAKHKYLQIDTETTGLHFKAHKILLFQVGIPGHQFLIDMRVCNVEPLRKVLESRRYVKIIQNALFDICFITHHTGIAVRNVWDTRLIEQVVLGMPYGVSTSLDANLKRNLNVEISKEQQTSFVGMDPEAEFTEEQLKYAALDVTYMEELAKKQSDKLRKQSGLIPTARLENKVVEVVAKMRLRGIRFDSDTWRAIGQENLAIYEAEKAKLPEGILWTSPKQVKEYFLSEHDIHITSYSELPKLVGKNDVLDQFIKTQGLAKKVNGYGENWFTTKMNNRVPISRVPTVMDDRVHCNYTQIVSTGRFSCSQPNLQQIPREGGYRECFIPDEGKIFVLADYTGQEIGIAAVLSQEEAWLSVLRNRGDVHGAMAAELFGENYTSEQRRIAKTINFTILYGGGSRTVADNLEIRQALATQYIAAFNRATPTLNDWRREQARLAEKTRLSFTKRGRKRSYHTDKFSVATKGMNTPIQGTGADIMKLALVKIDNYIEENNYPAEILLTVHDETITQCPVDKAEEWAAILEELMEQASTEVLGENIIVAEPQILERWMKV